MIQRLPIVESPVLIQGDQRELVCDPQKGLYLDGSMVYKLGEASTDQIVSYVTIANYNELVGEYDFREIGAIRNTRVKRFIQDANRSLGRVFGFDPFYMAATEVERSPRRTYIVGFAGSHEAQLSWRESTPVSLEKPVESKNKFNTPERLIPMKEKAQSVTDFFLDAQPGSEISYEDVLSYLHKQGIREDEGTLNDITLFLQRKGIISIKSDSPEKNQHISADTKVSYTRRES
jgi:hypothetical protein